MHAGAVVVFPRMIGDQRHGVALEFEEMKHQCDNAATARRHINQPLGPEHPNAPGHSVSTLPQTPSD